MLSFPLPIHDLMAPRPPPHNLQVPEWTKCSNREKRKEKEKPFYSDSEGESGPTESADSGEEMGRAGALCSCLRVCLVADYLAYLCAPVLGGHVSKRVCTSLCAPIRVLTHLRIARPRCVCACVGLSTRVHLCSGRSGWRLGPGAGRGVGGRRGEFASSVQSLKLGVQGSPGGLHTREGSLRQSFHRP